VQLTADAVAMWRTDPHIHGGATQMEPREVTARDKKRYFRFKSNHAHSHCNLAGGEWGLQHTHI